MNKLKWGIIGGGEGSQIGPAHRLGAQADGLFDFVAGAMDVDPEKGRAYAQRLGIVAERAYGDWREMLEAERNRPDRIDLVTVATPNSTHFEITKAFLEAGFHVLCEKPMTMTVAEGEEIVRLMHATGRICAVNYGYTAYPMVREMRRMVADGELGKIRLVVTEFSHGHHADAADADNPRVRWRYDPAMAGVSGQLADCGIHALNLASFITGQEIKTLSADFASCIESRELEDDAMVNFRMDGGTVGRLWTSTVAIGRNHGFTIQVYGENGGMRWEQERADQVYYKPLHGRLQIIERGEPGQSADASRVSRITTGHPEGYPLAIANIYLDLAEAIHAKQEDRAIDPMAAHLPDAEDGVRSIAAIYAGVESANDGSKWVDARPPMFRGRQKARSA